MHEEEKVEDFDEISRKMMMVRYFSKNIKNFKDYRTHHNFPELVSLKQREILGHTHLSLVVHALATSTSSADRDIWVGDTGASCHMRRSLKGMTKLRPGNSSVKIGSGSQLKVEKIGTFQGVVHQIDGTKQTITLDNVHYVPEMFCDLFLLNPIHVSSYILTK